MKLSPQTVDDPLLGQRVGRWYALGTVPYQTAWHWQQQLVSDYKRSLIAETAIPTEPPTEPRQQTSVLERNQFYDRLLLLQHPPVYTLGTGATSAFLRFNPTNPAYELHRVERGGEVTYHCPGQLVGYPILNLRKYCKDLHWYLRRLEEVLIKTLAVFNLKGERIDGLTGVWLEGQKVAAVGIKVSRWITMHGFALNVCPDLSGFERIVPCGIEDKPVGSLSNFLPGIDVSDIEPIVVSQFEQVFRITLEKGSVEELISSIAAELSFET